MRRVHLLVVAVLLAAGLFSPAATFAQDELTCFSETGFCISGRFRQYWLQNGGLPVFGFPISEPYNATNPDDGQIYLTQWFERNRFELHPEKAAPYDVLLGRLGDELLLFNGVDWQQLPRDASPNPQCIWFDQTGRNVCD